jgi:hypothetical protein
MAFIDGKLYSNTRNVGGANSIMDPWGQEVSSGEPIATFAQQIPERERIRREEYEQRVLEETRRRDAQALAQRNAEDLRRVLELKRQADAVHDESLEVFGMF